MQEAVKHLQAHYRHVRLLSVEPHVGDFWHGYSRAPTTDPALPVHRTGPARASGNFKPFKIGERVLTCVCWSIISEIRPCTATGQTATAYTVGSVCTTVPDVCMENYLPNSKLPKNSSPFFGSSLAGACGLGIFLGPGAADSSGTSCGATVVHTVLGE